jgi:hypothetical protein
MYREGLIEGDDRERFLRGCGRRCAFRFHLSR